MDEIKIKMEHRARKMKKLLDCYDPVPVVMDINDDRVDAIVPPSVQAALDG